MRCGDALCARAPRRRTGVAAPCGARVAMQQNRPHAAGRGGSRKLQCTAGAEHAATRVRARFSAARAVARGGPRAWCLRSRREQADGHGDTRQGATGRSRGRTPMARPHAAHNRTAVRRQPQHDKAAVRAAAHAGRQSSGAEAPGGAGAGVEQRSKCQQTSDGPSRLRFARHAPARSGGCAWAALRRGARSIEEERGGAGAGVTAASGSRLDMSGRHSLEAGVALRPSRPLGRAERRAACGCPAEAQAPQQLHHRQRARGGGGGACGDRGSRDGAPAAVWGVARSQCAQPASRLGRGAGLWAYRAPSSGRGAVDTPAATQRSSAQRRAP
jgi:hypothetical protein